jgi:hypothetical protein
MDKILQCPNCGSDRFYAKIGVIFNKYGYIEHDFEGLYAMETDDIRCFECDTAVDWIEEK